jgi:hypothetical protein
LIIDSNNPFLLWYINCGVAVGEFVLLHRQLGKRAHFQNEEIVRA